MEKVFKVSRIILAIPAFFIAAGLTNLILGFIFSWWNQGTTLNNLDEHLSGNFIQSLVLHGVGLFAVFIVYPNENKKPIFLTMVILEIVILILFVFLLSQVWTEVKSGLKSPALSKWNIITGFAGAVVSYFFIWKSVVND